jgi:hypothetical protein
MRYLTKSKFKLGLECPTKLFYVGKELYPNQKQSDPFLLQLANGGFQVEALARLKYGNGIMIEAKNTELATQKTLEQLQEYHTCLFEASFTTQGLHVRSDIVIKTGNHLKLIEVKAKSSKSSASVNSEFLQKSKTPKLNSSWEAYLWDIAFQKYVIQLCYPDFQISANLLLADKDAKSSINGINQKFKITNSGPDQRMNILVEEGLKYSELGNELLVEKDVTEIVNSITRGEIKHAENGLTFIENVQLLKDAFINDQEMKTLVGRQCKDCEFRLVKEESETDSQKSGFNRCWLEKAKVTKADLSKPKTYDIYSSGFSKKLMKEDGVLLAHQLNPGQLNSTSEKAGFSQGERQLLQLEDIKSGEKRKIYNETALEDYRGKINFPINMIDFETSVNALPFTKDQSPYETIAFQFSHHLVHKDGRIEHFNQWLSTKPNTFPNFEFVRALKKSLETNQGSIFRYHNHENNVLNTIKKQLLDSSEQDKSELIDFIELITKYKSNGTTFIGDRCMIDLHRLINDCYYNTEFAHSLSLKVVLPAMISTDLELQNKYTKTLESTNINSLNFSSNHCWLSPDKPNGLDPYSNLPMPFEGYSDSQLSDFFVDTDDKISNGGTAMMVYAKMQYTEMSIEERTALEKALLKYCELDTLAMVIVFEHLKPVLFPGI